ncbi:hypothetical protein ACIBBB_23200 [Streptomyces sp. NPDC051217]|uniref:hypothetical protein n=1 Tax=Streptomyces sp. NPDC051217 TaxID=3365644 RepID=UPI0037AC9F6E
MASAAELDADDRFPLAELRAAVPIPDPTGPALAALADELTEAPCTPRSGR